MEFAQSCEFLNMPTTHFQQLLMISSGRKAGKSGKERAVMIVMLYLTPWQISIWSTGWTLQPFRPSRSCTLNLMSILELTHCTFCTVSFSSKQITNPIKCLSLWQVLSYVYLKRVFFWNGTRGEFFNQSFAQMIRAIELNYIQRAFHLREISIEKFSWYLLSHACHTVIEL